MSVNNDRRTVWGVSLNFNNKSPNESISSPAPVEQHAYTHIDPPILTNEQVQDIRRKFNNGATVESLVDQIYDATGVHLARVMVYCIGRREIYRDVPEVDGSPCAPEGVYGPRRELLETNRHVDGYTPSSKDRVFAVLEAERTPKTVNEIASLVDFSPATVQNALGVLEAEQRVKSDTQANGPGRPRKVWSLIGNDDMVVKPMSYGKGGFKINIESMIMQLLSDTRTPLTEQEIIQRLGTPLDETRSALTNLFSNGQIRESMSRKDGNIRMEYTLKKIVLR